MSFDAAYIRVLASCLACFLLFGCQLATDFSLKPITENSEILCSDGRDGDFDGLTDCQDWNCLDAVACCDIPEVVLEDDFEGGPASCDVEECTTGATCIATSCGPDSERWYSWECPFPKMCGGELRIDKSQCFAGGVLSQAAATLGPGLKTTITVRGQPEKRGYLEAALTVQEEEDLPGALDSCGSTQEVKGFAAVRVVWAEDGYRITALFRGREVGRSKAIAEDALARVVIEVDRERRIQYALDDEVFASSDLTVPPGDTLVRLALSGVTVQSAFTEVRVEAGIRCHAPENWNLRSESLEASTMLAPNAIDVMGFDRDEVYQPAFRDMDGTLEVFYTGCAWAGDKAACDPYRVAVGHTILPSLSSPELVRDSDQPWVLPGDLTQSGVLLVTADPDLSICALSSPEGYGYGSVATGNDSALIGLDATMAPFGVALAPTATSAWDGGQVCCPTAIVGPDELVRLWYAGRAKSESSIPHIGLATSSNGGLLFTRAGEGPVLSAGPPGAFDDGGVSNPVVIYDPTRELYRMWYEGRDFFGQVAIGYAVSADGENWSRFAGNPVLEADDLGLATIGGPAVHRSSDGRLLMLVHGTTVADPRRRIYAVINDGKISD